MSFVVKCDLCGKATNNGGKFFMVQLSEYAPVEDNIKMSKEDAHYVSSADLCEDCIEKALNGELLSKLRESAEEGAA